MSDIIILKIFGTQNGRRGYKPKEQKKFTNVNDANHYIYDNNLCLYDLILNNKVLDRNGNGSPEKYAKQEKPEVKRFITVTNETKVFDFIQKETGVIKKAGYPFKKGDNNFAATFANKEDANKVWRYLNRSAAFAILQIDPNTFSLSFAVLTCDFNETIQWQPTELPQTLITSICKTPTEFANSFTFQQILDIFG